jgi:hypothetical protein
MKRNKRHLSDPAQTEMFAVVFFTMPHNPFRLRAGDVIRLDGRLGRVIRVNDCNAVVIVNRKTRHFTTRFDRHVHFQPKPAIAYISSQSEIPILNR